MPTSINFINIFKLIFASIKSYVSLNLSLEALHFLFQSSRLFLQCNVNILHGSMFSLQRSWMFSWIQYMQLQHVAAAAAALALLPASGLFISPNSTIIKMRPKLLNCKEYNNIILPTIIVPWRNNIFAGFLFEC